MSSLLDFSKRTRCLKYVISRLQVSLKPDISLRSRALDVQEVERPQIGSGSFMPGHALE